MTSWLLVSTSLVVYNYIKPKYIVRENCRFLTIDVIGGITKHFCLCFCPCLCPCLSFCHSLGLCLSLSLGLFLSCFFSLLIFFYFPFCLGRRGWRVGDFIWSKERVHKTYLIRQTIFFYLCGKGGYDFGSVGLFVCLSVREKHYSIGSKA